MVIMTSNLNEHTSDDGGVVLQPFLHQVSGRAAILSLDKTTVCKPLNNREHRFYTSLPANIKQFTPRFKGIVNVNVEESSDGSIALTAYPSKLEEETSTDQMTCKESSHDGGLDESPGFFSFIKEVHYDATTASTSNSTLMHRLKSCPEAGGGAPINPWTFKVQREGLQRYLRNEKKTQKCILLENVASNFCKPCILDLKMGTRVHGDYDDQDKQKRHQMKSEATTTKKLGVRLCGMQVFEPSTQTFHCRDKYFGRTLDREALRSVLRRFFSNGSGDVICRVIDRLQAIKSSLKQLRSYRFYSSSLLVIYDGAVTSSKPHNATAVDIRMVDFAKSTNSNLDGQMVHEGPDLGYIFGLTNLIQLLSEIVPSDSP